jgi:phi13 family phage major tail protein
MATRIGCDNLVFAKQLTEETSTTPATYDVVVAAPGVISIGVNPNAAQETLFADDGPMETATALGKIEVEIEKNELPVALRAMLLGHGSDDNGGLVFAAGDIPPFVAMGFRSLKSNGSYRYSWLYKGKFTDPDEKFETKKDDINFQTDTIKGQFVRLNNPLTIGGVAKKLWKYEIDEDVVAVNEDVISNWFNVVMMPNRAPLMTAVFAAGTATGATKATITPVAGAGNHFAYKKAATIPATPTIGDLIANPLTYVSAADITTNVANDVILLYELTATDTVIKFLAHTLTAAEIKTA